MSRLSPHAAGTRPDEAGNPRDTRALASTSPSIGALCPEVESLITEAHAVSVSKPGALRVHYRMTADSVRAYREVISANPAT